MPLGVVLPPSALRRPFEKRTFPLGAPREYRKLSRVQKTYQDFSKNPAEGLCLLSLLPASAVVRARSFLVIADRSASFAHHVHLQLHHDHLTTHLSATT